MLCGGGMVSRRGWVGVMGSCLYIIVWICTGGWGSLEGSFLGDAIWGGCVLSGGVSFAVLHRFFV